MSVEKLINGVVKEESRKGQQMSCPSCSTNFKFTVLNIAPIEDVYLYCDSCSNISLREEDRQLAIELMKNHTGEELNRELLVLYRRLEEELPECECGGRFKLWSNVKCPACNYEFPYNNGNHDFIMRSREAHLVWVEGSTAYRGKALDSNKLKSIT